MENFKIFFKDNNNTPSPHRRFITSGVLVVLVLTSFVVGVLFGDTFNGNQVEGASASTTIRVNGLGSTAQIKDVNFNLYWDVWNKLQERFIGKPVADADLFYSSIEGMVAAAGDPYTVFLRPQKAERFNQDLSGSFSGIGAELGMKKEIITIVAPLPDSPAERAGIKAGDKVLAVDGKDTYGWTLDEAVNKIRGKKGTTVKLMIFSDGGTAPREVEIIRDVIKVKSVKWEMKDQVAYIQISSFNEDTAELFDQSIRELVIKNPKAFVIDLRNDPGGFLDTAVRVASEWIEKGTIVTEKFSDGTEQTYVSNGKH
ncbi:MAG: S41 family peptidase, partial [Candidatus Magasanikbacteria bacterium]|nr:S41 family peptidase [Candidatus Magasanikbacteria bacterium]